MVSLQHKSEVEMEVDIWLVLGLFGNQPSLRGTGDRELMMSNYMANDYGEMHLSLKRSVAKNSGILIQLVLVNNTIK